MTSDDARARTAAWAAALLVAQQVAGKAVRDGLFLQAFEAQRLPWALVGAAALSLGAVFAISGLVVRRGPAGTLRLLLAVSASLLLGEWLLVQQAPAIGAVAVYAHAALFGATVVSVFFSLVSESFDPWTARVAMARIGLGASLGGVAGGLLALLCSRLLPAADLLLAVAALQGASLLSVAGLGETGGAVQPSSAADAAAGLRLVRRSPYLRDLALFVTLGALIQALLDVPLSTAARARFGSSGDLVTFFSAFHGASALLALVAQRSLASASLGSFGLAGTVAWRHGVVAVAAGLGAALPGLAAAIVARGGEALLSNSLFRSAYELLFTPLPESQKRPTKALVDVGCDKLGTAVGGGLALLVLLLPASLAQRAFFALAALGAGLALVMCRRLHEGYVAELASSLENGRVALSDEDALDSTTRYTLARTTLALRRDELLRDLKALGPRVAAMKPVAGPDRVLIDAAALHLGDTEAARRVLAREEPALDAALVPLAIPLLDRSELYLDALRALRRAAPAHAGALIDALLAPGTPETVRRRLPRALRGVDPPRAVPGLLMALLTTSFEVRYECGVALLRLVPEGLSLPLREEDVHGLAARELLHLRPGAGLEEPRRLEHVFHLLSLLHDRRALRSALWAVRGGGSLRGTALEYLDNVLPDAVAEPLFAALGTSRARTERKETTALAEQLAKAAPAGEPED